MRYRQARENLKKLRAMVRRHQNRGYATLERVAAHIEQLAVGDESNAAIDAHDAVSLMTVHASKGLEFPIVFVVNMNRGTGNSRAPIRVAPDVKGEPSVAIADYQSEADEDSVAKEREETKRLLYVALTRARDRLYLSGPWARMASSRRAERSGRCFPSQCARCSHARQLAGRASPGRTQTGLSTSSWRRVFRPDLRSRIQNSELEKSELGSDLTSLRRGVGHHPFGPGTRARLGFVACRRDQNNRVLGLVFALERDPAPPSGVRGRRYAPGRDGCRSCPARSA